MKLKTKTHKQIKQHKHKTKITINNKHTQTHENIKQ